MQATYRRHRHHETQAVIIFYVFSANSLGSYSRQPLRCIDLQFNTEPISVLDFSFDGLYLISGGGDVQVMRATEEHP